MGMLGKHGNEGLAMPVMRSIFPAHAMFLAAVALAAPAVAQAADNEEVRAAAYAFDDAQQHRDGAALDRLLAPDYLVVHASGRVGGRQEFIEGMTRPGVTLAPFEISDPLLVRPSPDTAIVGGEAWLRGTEDGRPFTVHYRYADTFAKRNGQWIVVYSQVTGLPVK